MRVPTEPGTAAVQRYFIALVVALALVSTGCGGGDSEGEGNRAQGSKQPARAEASAQPTREPPVAVKGKPGSPDVRLVESGFGQNILVRAIVIVTSDRAASVGEYVSADVKFLDGDGAVLGTGERVERFDWRGQQLVLVVRPNPDKYDTRTWGEVADIDVSLSIVNDQYRVADDEDDEDLLPLTKISVPKLVKIPDGAVRADFEFVNTTYETQGGMRFAVVCRDAANKIVGGEAVIEVGQVPPRESETIIVGAITSGVPERCSAYPGYPAPEILNS